MPPTTKTKTGGATSDAVTHGTYHFLDVGGTRYGECILVTFGERRILIDGSHEGDYEGQEGYDSIPEQLEQVLGGSAPYRIDLLVITHGHADHIGCVPDLVANNIIRPTWALVTDPKLGFGRTADDAFDPTDALDQRRVIEAALREEDASDMTDAELERFIDAASRVEPRYQGLMRDLERKQVRVIHYIGKPLPPALVELLRPTHITLLGPTQAQLLRCAEQISKTNKDAEDALDDALAHDATLSAVALYRQIAREWDLDDARNPRGSGMNCQSITLAFGPPGARVLLAGDMQFTEPGVTHAGDEVETLRRTVAAAGPYALFKTTHHTSHNGQDDALLKELGNPPLIVHSGGLRDPDHPYPATLKMLKARSRTIKFARTDRNGLITARPHLPADRALDISRGRLNDFTDNVKDELAPSPILERAAPSASPVGPQIIIVNLPPGPVDMSIAGVDIIVRQQQAIIVRTHEPVPAPASELPARDVPSDARPLNLAAGRDLPKLLFVTNQAKLEGNIGGAAAAALTAIRSKGHPLCFVSGSAETAHAAVRAALNANQNIKGVVILGGYDVVPSTVVDVLSPALRAEIGTGVDHDDFIVWSDEAYGDIDGDKLAELPVSRIPDARDTTLFANAFEAAAVVAEERYGVRNVHRPFSAPIWKRLVGTRDFNESELYEPLHVDAAHTSASCQYFMLHGYASDGRAFAGETQSGAGLTAFTIQNVPKRFRGLVFSGCCWGGLTVSQQAVYAGDGPIAPRVTERSIALAYLKAGANAFIGCTGAHYSGPDTDPKINPAVQFHDTFWELLPTTNYQAARTLWEARDRYGRWITTLGEAQGALALARRLKNRAQFTCLGLGW